MTESQPSIPSLGGIVYRNFDLELALRDGQLTTRVLASPEGEEEVTAAWPGLAHPLDAPVTLDGLSDRIGQALLPDAVGERWAASLAGAARAGEGLRLRLLITGEELAAVPWEAGYWRNQWLGLDPRLPLVRYVRAGRRIEPLAVDGPLRMLGIAVDSATLGLPVLGTERERQALDAVLQPLQQAGQLEVHWLEGAVTFGDLQEALRRRQPHLVHFIGHGIYDESRGQGALSLARQDRVGQWDVHMVGSTELALLFSRADVRFALLNACQTGQGAGGVARALVQREIPAALGMQSDIPDRLAVVFAAAFYSALAEGWPVDAAAVEGRTALVGQVGLESPWWAAPVLTMRAEDGLLWEREEAQAASPPVDPISNPSVAGDLIIADVSGQSHHVVVGKNNTQLDRTSWLQRAFGGRRG